ncbi:MAG: hypothetical protein ACRC1U_11110 [Vibrionaceae bacterium]
MSAPIKRGRPPLPESELATLFRFRIKPAQLEQLKAAAASSGQTMTAIITSAIDEALKSEKYSTTATK